MKDFKLKNVLSKEDFNKENIEFQKEDIEFQHQQLIDQAIELQKHAELIAKRLRGD